MEKNQNLPRKVAWSFGIANGLLQFSVAAAGSYFTFFITDICQLGGLVLGAISSISSIAVLISIFLWGVVFQYSNTKNGRYRPWLMGISTCVFVGYSLMYYNWNLSAPVWALLIIIGYSLANIGVSGLGVASYGLMTKVGSAEKERSSMMTFQVLLHSIVRVIQSAIILPFIILVGGSKTAPIGYFVYFAGFSFLAIVGYFYLYKVTKPYDTYDPNFKAGATKVSAFDMFKTLGTNKKLLIFFISDVLMQLLNLVKTFSMVYFLRYICGSLALYALYATLSPFFGVLGSAIGKFLIIKYDKVKLSVLFYGIQIITLIVIAIITFSNGTINPVLFMSILFIGECGNYAERSFHPTFYMDLAEYSYYKTEKSVTPIIMALANIPFKFGAVASPAIVGLVLANIGYVANAVQTVTAKNGIIAAVCFFPIVAVFQFSIMLVTAYKLDKKTVTDIYASNAEKRAAISQK